MPVYHRLSDLTKPRPLPAMRVLLVDDDRASQCYAATVLKKRLGLVVDIATTGKEAIGLLSQKPYALVLMDCHLPEMDGITAVNLIRSGSTKALNPKIPIIGYTADVFPENVDRCRCAGMNACLTKPTTITDLTAAVARWLPGPCGERERKTGLEKPRNFAP